MLFKHFVDLILESIECGYNSFKLSFSDLSSQSVSRNCANEFDIYFTYSYS